MMKGHQKFDLFNKKVFEKAIIEPPFRIIARMPNEACFFYVKKGCTKVVTPTQIFSASTNEGVVMNCGNYLNEYVESNEIEYCEAIAVHFYPDVLKMIYDKEFPNLLLNINQVEPLKVAKVKMDALLHKYIDSLQFYFDNPELVSDELLKIKLKELILLLAKTDNAHTVQTLLSALFTPAALNFKEIIEANLYNNLSLDELAALSHLSLSSFKREFTKQYNCSPARYIRRRKLEKAAQLLKSTELRISDIAFDCGFNDLAHFSKTFLKEYQFSPSDFRSS